MPGALKGGKTRGPLKGGMLMEASQMMLREGRRMAVGKQTWAGRETAGRCRVSVVKAAPRGEAHGFGSDQAGCMLPVPAGSLHLENTARLRQSSMISAYVQLYDMSTK